MFTYNQLSTNLRKGFRNRNWKKLSRVEKAFYRASLSYARIHGKVINTNVVEQLSELVDKLLETPGIMILKNGFDKAAEMLQKYDESGVFDWAPQLRKWLKDPDYIFWLGTYG